MENQRWLGGVSRREFADRGQRAMDDAWRALNYHLSDYLAENMVSNDGGTPNYAIGVRREAVLQQVTGDVRLTLDLTVRLLGRQGALREPSPTWRSKVMREMFRDAQALAESAPVPNRAFREALQTYPIGSDPPPKPGPVPHKRHILIDRKKPDPINTP